ncbi:T9SS type A sorting domain-containing protein [Spirosoma sp. SC4-14]|uniref:Ig-like domain-containing protein n=1 Tax=Spirosoma sp. SC4-14 TaxID=3128900 RepID=UPI0030D1754A
MFRCLCWLFLLFLLVNLSSAVRGQTILTNSLSVTSVCPGSSLEVLFTTDSQYNSGNVFTVELSDGTGFSKLETGMPHVIQTNRISAVWSVLATVPATTAAGTNYQVRVSASNPSVVGIPSSTTLTVKAVSPTPTTSAVIYCQNAQATSLSATTANSGSLNWYSAASGGFGSATAPIPNTSMAGNQTFYVTQTVGDNCESDRVPLTVTIKESPASPIVQANSIAYCQNAQSTSLSATGQNLKWYESETGVTSLTSITPVTSVTGTQNYYVSQTVNGCESPRTVIAVTVKPLPAAPTVDSVGSAYCQNSSAAPLTAAGQNLNWYSVPLGGTSLGGSVTPKTDSVGSFVYYVSQTVDGCQSSRSSVTVLVSAQPSKPIATNTYSFCQNATSATLTATGTALTWYDALGNRLSNAPVPSTDQPGTVSYFVTQTVNNCESQRAEISVITKAAPDAPGTTPLTVCQNTPAQLLTADGQNLRWYMVSTGGTSTTITPMASTSLTGQTNYYVTQTVDGCESARASVLVTVKMQPSTPGVTSTTLCQFTDAEPIMATGQNLKWYAADGTALLSAPTPVTNQGDTLFYLVSQTVDGCESNKALFSVTILTTPAPTVSDPIIEICLGATAQPLEAVGQNLKWTDPNGVVTTTAPTPPTLNATVKPDGDVYYVTQTGTNGCESPKVAIRVFVQTPPTMSIAGTTTVNLGMEVPLKLSFTGVGPYRYKLSNGLSGTSIKDTTILVIPERTTTYQVLEVANKCGVGLPGNGATATITVTVPVIQTLGLTSTTVCAGTTLSARFLTAGAFNSGSVFKLQIAPVSADTSTAIFQDVVSSQTENGQITGALSNTLAGGTYWVRVSATNPKIPVYGNISPTQLMVRPLATATLTGNQNLYEGQPASLTVAFTGDGPWKFSYRDSTTTLGTIKTVIASTNPYVFETRPGQTTAYYLTSVSNDCGVGPKVSGVAVVSVLNPLGIEDQSLVDALEIYPVPATTTLTIRINGLSASQPALLELTDLSGRTSIRQETRQATSILTLDQHPAGTYILRIRVGDRTASKRIVKL